MRSPHLVAFVAFALGCACAAEPSPDITLEASELVRAALVLRGAETSGVTLSRTSEPRDGLTHLVFSQRVDGRRVVGAYVKATLSQRGEVLHLIEHTVRVKGRLLAPTIDEAAAQAAALAHHGYPAWSRATAAFFFRPPRVEPVAYEADDGLAAGFLVETWSARDNLLDHTLVGRDGAIVSVEHRTAADGYLVFPVSPDNGAQELREGDGWLGSGAQYVDDIAGNNVHAYLDRDASNGPDAPGPEVLDEQFVAVADFANAPSTADNRAVAVQNFFYLSNTLHDVLYQHGFDEAAGNFQSDNFGLGGLDGDALLAEAQDGSGMNNANMACPEDGLAPRIQMYLYTGTLGDSLVTVGTASYDAAASRFGAALTTSGVSKSLAAFQDAVAPAGDACSSYTASLSNKIALVDPNGCDFVTKVYNAQRAGASAAIVINGLPGRAFAMHGLDARITIPSAMVSSSDGAALKTRLGQSTKLAKSALAPLPIDAALDGDIVAHEYGHGLTWRMIGGMSGKLAGAVGEGASDAVAFLMNDDDRVNEWARQSPYGARRWPYAGYPLSYGDVTGTQVHYDGEIFAAAMWRVLEHYLAAGLTRADLLHDFVQGMHYIAPTPSYESMRDGLLLAAPPERDCLVWRGFAEYGIGVGASGKINKKGNVVISESFALPASCP